MSNTLKFGNGQWGTKVGSTLAYNDLDGNFKPLPFDFTRSTSATRINKDGLIEVVTNNKPRIDFKDDAKGALLLEPSRTNIVPYSEDFSQSSWIKLGAGTGSASVLTPNHSISPDGTQNATRLQCDLNGGTTSSDQSLVYVIPSGSSNTYTNSFYVKGVAGQAFAIGRDLNNKKIILTDGTWQRVDFSYTNTPIIFIGSRGTYGSDDVLDIQIYGAQLEQGSYATSYIPTNGSTVQRAAETCNESGNSEVFNDSQGVLFADISTNSQDTYKFISINNGTSSGNQTRVALGYYGSTLYPNVRVSNSHQFNEAFVINPTLNNKIALKYKTNDFSLFVNGFEVLESNSGSTFSDGTLSKFDFDDGAGSSDFYGNTKQLQYFDTALTDAELEYMTSYRSLNEMVTELNLNAL